ncbi:hypothetical protein [Burkholderia gladioli]|uniref:hypothetical protein n=1 Tax=Burkholderia gladioli TaxID=28095 RepID=UPI00163E46F2|nr:hypothetical protein [Burkholderia gladioli]
MRLFFNRKRRAPEDRRSQLPHLGKYFRQRQSRSSHEQNQQYSIGATASDARQRREFEHFALAHDFGPLDLMMQFLADRSAYVSRSALWRYFIRHDEKIRYPLQDSHESLAEQRMQAVNVVARTLGECSIEDLLARAEAILKWSFDA